MEYGIIASTGLENVPATTLKDVIIILVGLLIVGLQVFNTFKKPTPMPQPLQIEKLDKFATRDFCEVQHSDLRRQLAAHDKDIAQLREEAKEDRRNNEVHASQRSSGLHKKIEDVRSELTDKIDDMPTRIIDQLSKLGLLRKPSDES